MALLICSSKGYCDEIISFVDPVVEALCVQNWDTDGDKKLSKQEAAAVTDLGNVFQKNNQITSFNELRYFTGLTSIGRCLNYTVSGWFMDCTSLESIIIPNGVNEIEDGAFYRCKSLSSINIPDGVKSISDGAFSMCTNLQTVNISNSSKLTTIGSTAFDDCSSLTSINIPDGVTSIGGDAFSGCTNLQTVSISKSSKLSSIGEDAFGGCGLTSFLIPARVETVGKGAFGNCSNIRKLSIYCKDIYKWFEYSGIKVEEIIIGNTVETIGPYAFDGFEVLKTLTFENNSSLKEIGQMTFQNCSSLTSINIPDGVTSIGVDAFRGCSGLTSVAIPNSVTRISGSAFYKCTGLKDIYAKLPNPFEIRESVFSAETYNNAVLHVDDNVESYRETFAWSKFFHIVNGEDTPDEGDGGKDSENYKTTKPTELSIGETFTANMSSTIGIFVVTGSKTVNLKKCGNVSRVEVPSTITYNGVEYTITGILGTATGDANQPNQPVFGSNVTEVVIPNTIESIGACAFWYCENMTSVTIPSSVTSIGDNAFLGSGLTSVIIPAGMTSIGEWAFISCSSLMKVVAMDGNPVNISGNPRFGDDILQSATLFVPSGKTTAYKNAGWNFTNIVELSALNDGDTFEATVGETTFKVKVLSAVNKTCQIGADSRGDAIVSGGKGWNGVIPSKVTGSDYQEYTVIGIGNRAFYEYDGRKSFTLPETLQQLSEGAFMRCHNLEYITIPSGLKTIGSYTFNGQESLKEVVSLIENPQVVNGTIDCGGRYGNNATLVVPAGKKNTYESMDGWSLFKRIVEMKPGDADGNEFIDPEDVQFTKDFIMTNQGPDGFVRQNADTNGDNEINVIDIVEIVKQIK